MLQSLLLCLPRLSATPTANFKFQPIYVKLTVGNELVIFPGIVFFYRNNKLYIIVGDNNSMVTTDKTDPTDSHGTSEDVTSASGSMFTMETSKQSVISSAVCLCEVKETLIFSVSLSL